MTQVGDILHKYGNIKGIKTFSNEGNLVLDNCMGSNTTGLACMNTGRKFIGVEKDEKYFDISLDRIRGEILKKKGYNYE